MFHRVVGWYSTFHTNSPEAAHFSLKKSCVVLCCVVFVALLCLSKSLRVVISLEFGVFGGSAFSFMQV